MSTLSVVIRALNEAEHLPALFSGLATQSRQPTQVVVVGSGSVDDTVAIARAHGAEIVHIAPDEFSFGRSLNARGSGGGLGRPAIRRVAHGSGGHRLGEAGPRGWLRIVYEADARIVHVHDETFDEIRNRFRREAIAHRRIFPDHRMSMFQAAALFRLSIGRDDATARTRRCLGANLAAIPRFRAAQYLGAFEGFRHRRGVSTELRRRFHYPAGFTTRRGDES